MLRAGQSHVKHAHVLIPHLGFSIEAVLAGIEMQTTPFRVHLEANISRIAGLSVGVKTQKHPSTFADIGF